MSKNLKALYEKRNALMDEMDALLGVCEGEETRAFNEQEAARFGEIETEVRGLDATIHAAETREQMERREAGEEPTAEVERRALEEQSFLSYCRGETRALDAGGNGGIIPTSIAQRIIEKVKDLSPIYGMVTLYNVKGDLVVPLYDEENSSVKAAYVEELTELTEGTGKFKTVTLKNFIAGALAKISKSLMNRTDFDLLSFIVYRVASAIAEFLERELVAGTGDKMQGVMDAPVIVTTPSATAITADDLIDLQMTVPQVFQGSACWVMHRETFKAIRKLKDSDGNYILNKDVTKAFGWELLGQPVYTTDSAAKLGAGNKVIAYGDMSGLSVKLSSSVEIQVLMEKFATQYAVGVVGYVECDSKITETQKLAVLQMKA